MQPQDGIERLLSSLTGVVSAHVVADREGRIQEIHVLATPELHPKQVVRNVESALRAGLGIEIDRRIVSVAQLGSDIQLNGTPALDAVADQQRVDRASPEPERVETVAMEPQRTEPGADAADAVLDQRLVFVGFDARCRASREAVCRVVLQRGSNEFAGVGEGPDTPQGRAEAAARAVFAALSSARGEEDLGLEGASLVDAHGRTYVVVSAHALEGRHSTALAGAAPLDQSPEEAAILAALQATNRWSDISS